MWYMSLKTAFTIEIMKEILVGVEKKAFFVLNDVRLLIHMQ